MTAELEIAERKQLDSALLESEQRYKRLLSATTDYVYSVQVYGGQSEETLHGPGCEAVTGYTSREFSKDPYLAGNLITENRNPGWPLPAPWGSFRSGTPETIGGEVVVAEGAGKSIQLHRHAAVTPITGLRIEVAGNSAAAGCAPIPL